jgi:hypothetical protein
LRSPWFALVPAVSTLACVLAITLWPWVAKGLGILALIAVPCLATVALGVAMRGARFWLVGVAPVLCLMAVVLHGGLLGQLSSVALTSLSTISLAALVTYLTPLRWLRWGIVAMSVVDIALVATGLLEPANSKLNAAVVAPLPKLQLIHIGGVTQGYGDLFLAAIVGGLLARKGGSQLRFAILLGALVLVLDASLLPRGPIPETVAPATAMLVAEILPPMRRALRRLLSKYGPRSGSIEKPY